MIAPAQNDQTGRVPEPFQPANIVPADGVSARSQHGRVGGAEGAQVADQDASETPAPGESDAASYGRVVAGLVGR